MNQANGFRCLVGLLATLIACSPGKPLASGEGKLLYSDGKMSISELTEKDRQDMEKYREAARTLIAAADPGHENDRPVPPHSIQRAVDRADQRTNATALLGLGVLIGDYFIDKHGMVWLVTTDEYGRDPVVSIPRTVYSIGALTVVTKRISDGTHLDVLDFISQVEEHMKKNAGQYRTY